MRTRNRKTAVLFRRVCSVLLLGSLAVVAAAGCATLPPFNEAAYEQAVSLKVESLALMGRAAEPFEEHREEAGELLMDIEKAYEFAKGRPGNEISTRQWEVLMDPDRNLLGGFFSRWERDSVLSAAFVREAKGIVSDAFDTIIGLESRKVRASQVK